MVSFHGMQQKYIERGDPYQAQCIATTESLRKRMGLDATRLMLTFQSRFGFDQWLQPNTDKTIEQLAKDGIRRIAVVTPASPPIAWKRWRRSRRRMPKSSSTMAASSSPLFPVSTTASPAWT